MESNLILIGQKNSHQEGIFIVGRGEFDPQSNRRKKSLILVENGIDFEELGEVGMACSH